MSKSQMRWYSVRRGCWRGILASLFGSAAFAVFLAATFIIVEFFVAQPGGSRAPGWPAPDQWLSTLAALAILFLLPFGVGLLSSAMAGCFGGAIIGLACHILAVRNLSKRWTLVAGLVVGGIAGYLSSELAIRLVQAQRIWDFIAVACVIASLCGAWVGRRLASDYEQRSLAMGTGTD